jgi:hypothetical protein
MELKQSGSLGYHIKGVQISSRDLSFVIALSGVVWCWIVADVSGITTTILEYH